MRLDVAAIRTAYRSGRFAISGGSSEVAESVLVRVAREDPGEGTGLGEAVPSKRVLGVDAQEIQKRLQNVAGLVAGLDLDPDASPPAVPDVAGRDGGSGVVKGPVACALDGALLDAWAQARDEPLWRALDLPRPEVATTATVSLGSPEEMAEEAEALVRAGFAHLKVKLGGDDGEDPRRLEGLRERVPRVVLRVDANEGWDRRKAVAMVASLAEAGVELVEQPLSRSASVTDHHTLNRTLEEHGIPHVLDETVHVAEDARRIAREGLAHGVNLKLQKAGGLRPGLELIEAAREGGLQVMVGCYIETWAGIALALQVAGRVDWADLDGAWLLAEEPVVPREPFLADGVVSAGSLPGLGVKASNGVFSG